MTKNQKKFITTTIIFSWISGAGIYILDTWFYREGDFGLTSHPWLDELKAFHYIWAPFLVFSLGMIFSQHILPGLQGKKPQRKKSGYLISIIMLVLVLSGQSLLYITGELTEEIVSYLHAGLGLLFVLGYFIHSRDKSRQ